MRKKERAQVQLRNWILGLFDARPRIKSSGQGSTASGQREPATHVVILDGTMSSLAPGRETNAGLTFRLLRAGGPRANLTVYYEAGIQWLSWRSTIDVMLGRGLNQQIERAYGVLASRWRPGDRIVLVGYSRGAYAVRSLAGVIGRVGLVSRDHATVRNIQQAYRHYRAGVDSAATAAFCERFCDPRAEIEAVAVWDTVKALGLRVPILWRWAGSAQEFHDHRLGAHVRNGFQALALDETREAYAPVLWQTPEDWRGNIEQVWFRGSHGDVGGQLNDFPAARPLANIPLVWMLDRLAMCGVPLPGGWQERYPRDACAPSAGSWSGWGKLFWSRRRRIVGRDPSERLHASVGEVSRGWWGRKTLGALCETEPEVTSRAG